MNASSLAPDSNIPSYSLGMSTMRLYTPAFLNEGTIPSIYTCDGEERPIPLTWANAPEGTISFVVICDDPDAPMGTWDHWVVYNIPAHISQLEDRQELPDKAHAGLNSWKRTDYGGPCPPDGEHRYFFRIYALDINLTFTMTPVKADIHAAMSGHILATGELMGRYNRIRPL